MHGVPSGWRCNPAGQFVPPPYNPTLLYEAAVVSMCSSTFAIKQTIFDHVVDLEKREYIFNANWVGKLEASLKATRDWVRSSNI